MSKAMSVRPSEIYKVEKRHGTFAAYCFDSAIIAWGTAFEGALEVAASEAKSTQAAQTAQGRVLRKWLGAEAVGGYADPARR